MGSNSKQQPVNLFMELSAHHLLTALTMGSTVQPVSCVFVAVFLIKTTTHCLKPLQFSTQVETKHVQLYLLRTIVNDYST